MKPLGILKAAAALLGPRSLLHLVRMMHFHSYSHVRPRAAMHLGAASAMAPNVSLRNGERIIVGSQCHIGEGCHLWAGDSIGRIELGDRVSLAPGVFITASDYQFVAGIPFRDQTKRERDVRIGNDVWMGANVVVTAGVAIGDGCIVGAGAVVTRDLPGNCIAGGVPARIIGQRPESQSCKP